MRLTKIELDKWKASVDGQCTMASNIHLGKAITVTDLLDTIDALEQESAAQVAVMLGKAAKVGHTIAFEYLGMQKDQRMYGWHDVEDALSKGSSAILALIPADAKEALKQHDADEWLRGHNDAIAVIITILIGAPVENLGPESWRGKFIRALALHDADFREKLCREMGELAGKWKRSSDDYHNCEEICIEHADELLAAIAKIREG